MERTTPADRHDSTHDDHERFERRQLAHDRDANQQSVLTVDQSQARERVDALVDADVVDVVPEAELLVHTPSGRRFQNNRALVLFHKGWQARTDGDGVVDGDD
jgi:hypothetical protein